jgi:NTP pyrophosphatase (non-canonical NTP hydrolase)
MNTVQELLDRCRAVKYPRDIASILRCVVAEVGELSEEVDIACGTSYKQPDVDGVVGEAVDVLLATFDLIATNYPEMTSEEVFAIMDKKMSKWESKTRAHMVQKSLNP